MVLLPLHAPGVPTGERDFGVALPGHLDALLKEWYRVLLLKQISLQNDHP